MQLFSWLGISNTERYTEQILVSFLVLRRQKIIDSAVVGVITNNGEQIECYHQQLRRSLLISKQLFLLITRYVARVVGDNTNNGGKINLHLFAAAALIRLILPALLISLFG